MRRTRKLLIRKSNFPKICAVQNYVRREQRATATATRHSTVNSIAWRVEGKTAVHIFSIAFRIRRASTTFHFMNNFFSVAWWKMVAVTETYCVSCSEFKWNSLVDHFVHLVNIFHTGKMTAGPFDAVK